jgi:methylated-DNA-[protein]-cysteine S-methyltransferase
MSSQPSPLYSTTHSTPVGELTLIASDRGLRTILWPEKRGHRNPAAPQAKHDPNHPILRRTITELDEYFAGTRTSFDIPLDLVGTPFQLSAWRALADIPYGETTSYGRQAAALGMPTAARALGAANGANPVCIVLPCHRVIGANGSLTGFGGGLERKQFLLDLEARVSRSARTIEGWPSRHPVQRRLSMPVA